MRTYASRISGMELSSWPRCSRCNWSLTAGASPHLVYRLDQSPDVTVAVGERLQPSRVVRRLGYMVGHQHVWITDFFVDLNGLDEIDIAFVRINLDKLVPMPADITEVDVEDLLARAKVTNH